MTKAIISSLTIITLAHSQHHIRTIMASLVAKKNTFFKIWSHTVEDEIDYVGSRDAENHDNIFINLIKSV